MEELIAEAQREVQLLAYVVTPSAQPVLGGIESALQRGVRASIVINVIPGQSIQMLPEFDRLAEAYPHLKVRYFKDPDGSQLHAKILVTDRRHAVVGSANYTWGGMIANHEIGVLIAGEAAWDLGQLVDRLEALASEAP